MSRYAVDYNTLSASYDARYDFGRLAGIQGALEDLIHRLGGASILEVGCGTGHWLKELEASERRIFGVDASTGMLAKAAPKAAQATLIAARANALPLHGSLFNLVYAVNAVHHFDDPRDFIEQAHDLLKPGGALSIIGIEPRSLGRYFYQYFDGTLERDFERFPSFGQMVDWMALAGFERMEYSVADRSAREFNGADVFNDPFLVKTSNSLLASLTDAEYEEGLKKMRRAVDDSNGAVRFRESLSFLMLTAFS